MIIDTKKTTVRIGSQSQLARGPRGFSAYEVWLQAGNRGTEDDYLSSLKGNTGPKGENGAKGETGPRGPQGVQGLQGPKGQDGTVSFNDLSPAQKAQLKGERGPQGIPGAKGDRGERGMQGIQGLQGPQGTRGVQGERGPQGTRGVQGERGPQGFMGPQGPQGIQGAPGANGHNATINGVTAINIVAGDNVNLDQTGNTLIISATGGSEESVGSGNVDDVKVDGVSVVQNKIANIELRKSIIGILYEYGLIKLDELTPEQINALETMDISINENGELITNFNNEVLNIEFTIVDNNLIVNSLENGIDFNINNKELEVDYNG